MAGYSSTPLHRKLGIKPGHRVALLDAPTGLVYNKVCAIDEIWSGLRLVIRRENRLPAE